MDKQTYRPFQGWRTAIKAVKQYGLCAFLCAIFLGALYCQAQPVHAATGINPQINYQGRLLDSTGAIVPDGTYNMEFKIYQDGDGCVPGGSVASPCGGTLKWTETRTTTNRVTVRNGYFNVQLGEVTAFGTSVNWNQSSLWLSVNIGGTATTPVWDGEMLPFRRLGADAYAMNANALGGLDYTHYVQVAPSAVQTDTNTSALSTVFLNKDTSATGNILELQKSGSDVFVVGNSGAVTVKSATTATSVLTINRASDGLAGLEVRVSGVAGADPGNNLFMGVGSGVNVTPIAGATAQGVRNIGIGDSTLAAVTTGDNNIAMGMYTLQSLTTGNYNSAVGEHSLASATTAVNNNAFGALALNSTTTGSYNSAMGASALTGNTTGSGNVAIGDTALGSSNGDDNTAVGFNAGTTNTTGAGITLLGAFSNVGSGALFNATAVGYDAIVSQSNAIALGGTGSNAVSVGIGTATPSAVLHISTSSTSTDRIRITDTVGTALNEFQITSTGATTFQDRTDASSTFTILKSSGAAMFNVNTTSNYISVGGSANEVRFGIGISAPTANLNIVSALANDRILVTDTTGGGSVNVFRIDSAGVTTFQDRTDAANTFSINNSSGVSKLLVDTTDNFVDIGFVASGNNANARLGFGDMGCTDTLSPTAAACVWVGEKPGTDTDVLQMHGNQGAIITYGSSGTGTVGIGMDNAGKVGIGTATPDFQLTVINSTSGGGMALENAASTAGAFKIYTSTTSTGIFGYANAGSDWATGTAAGDTVIGSQTGGLSLIAGNATRIRIANTGVITLVGVASASGTGNSIVCVNASNQVVKGTTTTCNPSSIRFKENVQDMAAAEGLSTISKLRPVSFSYKSDPTHANQFGFIAEEVVNVLPEDIAYDDQGQIYGVNYEMIVPNLVKAIQEQQVEIAQIQQGVWTGGIVANDSTFNGLVTFNGAAKFNSDTSFSGKVTFNNNVTFASNTAGTATIPAHETSMTVNFTSAHPTTPVVNATPKDFIVAGFRVRDVSPTQFTIELAAPQANDVTFSWSALDAQSP